MQGIETVDEILSKAGISPKVFDKKSLKSRLDLAEEIENSEVKLFFNSDLRMPERVARGISLLVKDQRGRYLLEEGRSYWKNGRWIHVPKRKPQTATETRQRMQHGDGEPELYEDIDLTALRCKREELVLADDVGELFVPTRYFPYWDVRKSNVYYRTRSLSQRDWRGLILPTDLPERFRTEAPVFEDTQRVMLHTRWYDSWPFDFPPFQTPIPTASYFTLDERLRDLTPLLEGLRL